MRGWVVGFGLSVCVCLCLGVRVSVRPTLFQRSVLRCEALVVSHTVFTFQRRCDLLCLHPSQLLSEEHSGCSMPVGTRTWVQVTCSGKWTWCHSAGTSRGSDVLRLIAVLSCSPEINMGRPAKVSRVCSCNFLVLFNMVRLVTWRLRVWRPVRKALFSILYHGFRLQIV